MNLHFRYKLKKSPKFQSSKVSLYALADATCLFLKTTSLAVFLSSSKLIKCRTIRIISIPMSLRAIKNDVIDLILDLIYKCTTTLVTVLHGFLFWLRKLLIWHQKASSMGMTPFSNPNSTSKVGFARPKHSFRIHFSILA